METAALRAAYSDISSEHAAIAGRSSPSPLLGLRATVFRAQPAASDDHLGLVESQAMEPEDLTVIGHTGNLLVDIYTAKYDAYLHFTAVLNAGGKGAQSRRNGCSI